MLKNRVKQYTTTLGTGTVTLNGSYNGYNTFASSFSDGDKLYYVIESGPQWEIGIGTYSSGTLTRDTLIQSSTGSKISLVGRSSVYVDLPASKYLYANDNNVVIVPTGGLKFSDNTTITSVNDIEPVWGTISGSLSDQTDLIAALNNKSDISHNHSGVYQPLDSDLTAIAGISTNSYGRQVLSFSGSDELRTHASVYSSGEVDSLLSSKANNNVNIIAGSGLSGGGNLTADRTFSLSTTPVTTGTYSLATITVDQFGRITAASGGSVDLSSYLTSSTASSTYVPLTRTINGVDLSVNRTLSIGNSGTDAAWSGLTLNIPDASATNRGLITNGGQTIAGNKVFTGNVALTLAVYQISEPVNTPSGTTQTITLNDDNHQTLDLSSATGSVTATLTVPSGSCAGTIIVKQHGSASKGITWAVSSGSIKWLGTQPTWGSDAAGSYRVISWRWNGSIMFLMSTESGS